MTRRRRHTPNQIIRKLAEATISLITGAGFPPCPAEGRASRSQVGQSAAGDRDLST